MVPPALDSSIANVPILVSPAKKGLKRKKCPEKWKRNVQKQLRNKGKMYEMHTKRNQIRAERKMKPPCGEKCRLTCSQNITEEARNIIFTSYWNLGDVTKQRQFIVNSMKPIEPSYRYIRTGGKRPPRRLNNAFYFHTGDKEIRVCKLFFMNTLDINDRPIRTALEKRNKACGAVIESDNRGKHDKHSKVDES